MIDTSELTLSAILTTKVRKIIFAKLSKHFLGTAMQGVIVLDPRVRTPIARTLLHELIHVRRPMWSESQTFREERRLWYLATWQEIGSLYKMLGKAQNWAGEQEFEEAEIEHESPTLSIIQESTDA